MAAIDKVIEDGHTLATESAPVVPAELSLAFRVENAAHQISEFAGGKGAALTRGFVYPHVHEPAVYRIDSILFMPVVVAHLRQDGSYGAVVIVSRKRIDILARHAHTDKVRQILVVGEGVLPDRVQNLRLAHRIGRRNRGRFDVDAHGSCSDG